MGLKEVRMGEKKDWFSEIQTGKSKVTLAEQQLHEKKKFWPRKKSQTVKLSQN